MSFAELLYATPLFRVLVNGSTPARLSCLPPQAWPGDATAGDAIIGGTMRCAGQPVRIKPPEWHGTGLNTSALVELHSFNWLNDLAAAGGSRAPEAARALVIDWIERESGWDPLVWSPAVLGTRIAAWLTHARFLAREADPLGARILKSLAGQARHLARVAPAAGGGIGRLAAVRGLVFAAACGLGSKARLTKAERLLSAAVAEQFHPDGGYITRNPADQLRALAMLTDIRDMLLAARVDVSTDLTATIERATPMLRLFRHGDGKLALFNGAREGDRAMIEEVLRRTGVKGEPLESAPSSGFERIAAAQTCLIIDAGAPPPEGCDANAGAGTLSFELSYGRERLVVNCGALGTTDPQWRLAQRSTAAHSTVTIDDRNSSEITDRGIGRRPTLVTCRREATDGAMWITASHDGYRSAFGITHQRRIYVAADGEDVRGEDLLTGGKQGEFSVRFHLHPEVSVSLIHNGAAALMKLPSGGGWRLQASGGQLGLGESIYLGGTARQRIDQITIAGRHAGDQTVIKWALRRLSPA